jgi:hypothetical protein
MVRDVLAAKEVDGEMLSDNQIEGIEFANGMRRYLDGPRERAPGSWTEPPGIPFREADHDAYRG